MKRVTVANVNVQLAVIDSNRLNKGVYEYENNNFRQQDMTLKTITCDEIKKPKGYIMKIIDTATLVQISSTTFCMYITDMQTGQIVQANYYNHDYSEVEIHLLKLGKYLGQSLSEFEYFVTGIAYSDRLAALGGAVLHGSAIAFENQGIVFSANSGTGKSTHTSLWKECFGDRVTIINDDKPAIRFYENTPIIFGTPWSGKTDLNTNIQVPLKAIVFIKRSDSNWIERLTVRDSIFHLASQITRPYYDENLGRKTLEIIEKLVRHVPIYRLHCNMSQEAVDVAYQNIMKKGEKIQ